MPEPTGTSTAWWRRRSPSTLVLLGVVAVMALAAMLVGRSLADVLDDVPKDRLGTDPWEATLGVEGQFPFQVAYIPECAAGSVTRLVLWDADSNPIWEVSGPPTPLTSFTVGGTPDGFEVTKSYEQPEGNEVLRLVAFRRVGEPIGLRYRTVDVVNGRVIAMAPLRRFSVEGFQGAEVCGSAASGDPETEDALSSAGPDPGP